VCATCPRRCELVGETSFLPLSLACARIVRQRTPRSGSRPGRCASMWQAGYCGFGSWILRASRRPIRLARSRYRGVRSPVQAGSESAPTYY
jgi:hypothetical protein